MKISTLAVVTAKFLSKGRVEVQGQVNGKSFCVHLMLKDLFTSTRGEELNLAKLSGVELPPEIPTRLAAEGEGVEESNEKCLDTEEPIVPESEEGEENEDD